MELELEFVNLTGNAVVRFDIEIERPFGSGVDAKQIKSCCRRCCHAEHQRLPLLLVSTHGYRMIMNGS